MAALPFDGPLADRLQDAGIPCHEMPISRRLDSRPGQLVEELVRRGVDLVHSHTPKAAMLVARPAARARRCGGRRAFVVTHINGLGTAARLAGPLAPWVRVKKTILRGVEKIAERSTDRFIFVTEADRRRGFHDPAKSRVVANGIEPDLWPRVPLPDSDLILFPARLSPQKDPFTLMETAALLRDRGVACRFDLAGDGELRPEVERLVHEKRLEDRIRLLGDVVEMQSLYRQSRLVVLPTHYEGQPFAFLEAMATGRPIIASDVDGNAETLGDAGIVTPPRDPAALAAAIEGLLGEPAMVARLADAGRRRFEKFFTAEAMIDGVATVYEELLG